MAKKTYVKVGGVWKEVKNVWIKVGGVWKQKTIPKIKVSGIWKDVMSYGYRLFAIKENGSSIVEKINDETGIVEKTSPPYSSSTNIFDQWSVVDKDGNLYVSFGQTIVKYDKDMNEIARRTYLSTSEIISAFGTDIQLQTVTDTHLIAITSSTNSSSSTNYIYAIPLNLGTPEQKVTLGSSLVLYPNCFVYHKATNQFIFAYGAGSASYLRKYDANFNAIVTLNHYPNATAISFLGLTKEGIYMFGIATTAYLAEKTYDVNTALTSGNIVTRYEQNVSGDAGGYKQATPATTKDGKVYYTYHFGSSANANQICRYDTINNTRTSISSFGPYSNSTTRYDWCPTGKIEQILTNPKGELFVRDDGLVAKLNMNNINGAAVWLYNQGTTGLVASSEGTPYELPGKWL